MKNWLVHRVFEDAFIPRAEKYLNGRLIDIGSAGKPYEEMLSHLVDEHVGLDHKESLHDISKTDLLGTAYDIPATDNSFDSGLCTAVLEHLEEPLDALIECRRVVKPGGYVIYSIPFIWHIHEKPRDFYRYSKYGIKYLFEKAGFTIIEIKPLSGFWTTFGQLFIYYIQRLNRGPLKWLKIIDGFSFLFQRLLYSLNKYDSSTKWTWMYLVIAENNE